MKINKIKKFRSIRHKLVFLLSFSAVLAIFLSSASIFIYTLNSEKTQSVNNLVQLSNIVAKNLMAPIEFDDELSAENLLKSLKLNQNIEAAFLYKEEKGLFASYEKSKENKADRLNIVLNLYEKHTMKNRFDYIDRKYIVSGVPIYFDEEFIASFVIVSDTKAVEQTIREQFITQISVAFITILLIVLLAFRLEKIFTLPIFRLKNTMQKVSLTDDYTIHVKDKRDDEFQDLFDGFNNMIDITNENKQQLNERAQKILSLLNHAGQGFLSINKELIIDDEYSKECNNLLAKNLSGKNIAEILLQTKYDRDFFKESIEEVFNQDDEMLQECILSLLPVEIIRNKKALKIEYKIMNNERIMLVVTNITAQKKLEKKIKQEQETLKMIVEIVSDSEMFFDTKNEYERFIDSLSTFVDKKKMALDNINNIYRIIHTYKGAFSQLYMQKVVNTLHLVESDLSVMIQENKASNEELCKLLNTNDFKASLEKELKTISGILGEEFLRESKYIKINNEYLNELQSKIITFMDHEDINDTKYKDLFEKILNLSKVKLITILRPYNNLVNQLAKRLEKEIYRFEIVGDGDIVITEEYKPFLKTLIHVFRNSIDHGIESPETRVENQKDERGMVECIFEQIDNNIQITIKDDGAGIDKELVIKKAIEENILTEKDLHAINEKEIFDLIFHNQFSTKDEISDISGRGVGMNAVKVELEKIGGFVLVESEINVGTTFIFTIPYQEN